MEKLTTRLSAVRAELATKRKGTNNFMFVPWLSSQAKAEVAEMKKAYQFLVELVAEAAEAVKKAGWASDSNEVEEIVMGEIKEEIADGLIPPHIGKKMMVAQFTRLWESRRLWAEAMEKAEESLGKAEEAMEKAEGEGANEVWVVV